MAERKVKYAPGKNPNSLAALRKGGGWKPGQSGNPKGRPPGIKYVGEALRDLLEADPNLAHRLAKSLAKRALKSDAAISIVFERTEGKVTQPIEGQITADITFIIGKGYAEDKGKNSANDKSKV